MKKKTNQVVSFIEEMHGFIIDHPQFRKDTRNKTEFAIQAELRPILLDYLERHFQQRSFKDYTAKANRSFYWEGQEGQYGKCRGTTFGARNYPDFIITDPYLIAVEYKQSQNGSTIKQGIGQSIMHTLCNDFHYVYYLFHDQNKDKRIQKSTSNGMEEYIVKRMRKDFNVFIYVV